ncbi:MAG: hypothetical protein HYW49_01300 [Deltaproteobacteria bacterium]|nr:hypothetical protein [Deltaproteobacteria bacterium]
MSTFAVPLHRYRPFAGRFIFCLALNVIVSAFVFAQTEGAQHPRVLYDQGRFREALQALEKTGIKTGADFYNAANCYFRLGETGRAYAYYQKAATLLPGSDDIASNLALAAATLDKSGALMKDGSIWRGKIVPLSKRAREDVLYFAISALTLWIAALAFRAKSSALTLAGLFRKGNFLSALIFWAAGVLTGATLLIARSTPLAVVTADAIAARSGPSETFTELFKLTAGTRVESGDRRQAGWVQIRFSLGNVGWVMEKDLLTL